MALWDEIKKRAQGVVAQVNQNDNGATYKSVVNAPKKSSAISVTPSANKPKTMSNAISVTPKIVRGFDTSAIPGFSKMSSGKQAFELKNRGVLDKRGARSYALGSVDHTDAVNTASAANKLNKTQSATMGAMKAFADASIPNVVGAGLEYAGRATNNNALKKAGQTITQPIRNAGNEIQSSAHQGAFMGGNIAGNVANFALNPLGKAGVVVNAARMGMPTAANVSDTIERAGGSQKQQVIGGGAAGLVDGVSSALGSSMALGKPIAKQILNTTAKRYGATAATGAFDNVAQQLAHNAIAQKTYDPNAKLTDNLGTATLVGAAMPVAIRAATSPAARIATKNAAVKTVDTAKTANRRIEQVNPKVRAIDDAVARYQRAFDVETNPIRRAQINRGMAELNAERQMLTQGGYAKFPFLEDGEAEIPKHSIDYAHSVNNADELVKSTVDYWYKHGKDTKGGQMLKTEGVGGESDSYRRISEHNQFYSDFYKKFKRAPTRADYQAEVMRQLDAGGGSMADKDMVDAYQLVKGRQAESESLNTAKPQELDHKWFVESDPKYKATADRAAKIRESVKKGEELGFSEDQLKPLKVEHDKLQKGMEQARSNSRRNDRQRNPQSRSDHSRNQTEAPQSRTSQYPEELEVRKAAKGRARKDTQPTNQGEIASASQIQLDKSVQRQEAQLQPVTDKQTSIESSQKRDLTYPDNTTDKINKRGFTQSVKGSDEVSGEVRKGASGEYNVRSTAKLAISADSYARGDIEAVTKDIHSRLDTPTGKINDQDIADSIAVAKRLDAEGNHEQATQIYDKLAEHGTKGGQAIQAFSLLKNRTPDGIRFSATKQLKKVGVTLNKAEEKELAGLIGEIKNTKDGSEARDEAIFATVDFVSRKIPTSKADQVVNFWRAGLLTAPRTTAGNILGNASEAATRELWTNPVAVATDKFFSMFTGQRTKTMAGGQIKGAKEGVEKGVKFLKTGFDPRNVPSSKYDTVRRVNYKNKVVDTYVNGVYRWMGGQDQPFYYAAKSAAAYDLAKADGMNLKLKGKDLAEYIERSVADENWKPQTFKTGKDATDYGKYAVYQNETMLGSMAAGLKKGADKFKGGRAITDFILPFTQVPSSVAMRIVDRTPVGIAREMVKQFKAKSFDQRAMSEAIANGSFGIPVVAAGVALASSGELTGAYPTDSREKKLWESEGKQPYSVRVGDRWYSLNYMQPFGTLLAIGKNVADDKADGKSEAEAWMNATGAAAKSVESQSFLQGLNGLLSAINDPQRSMKRYFNNTVGGFVPNAIRSTATAIDPYQREVNNAGEAIMAGIPKLRENLDTKIDMFGKDMTAKDTPLNQLLNPLKPSRVKGEDDSVLQELRRLQDSDNGIVTTEFTKKSIGGVELTNEQVRNLNQLVNTEVKDWWGKAMQTQEYANMSDEDKATTLKKFKDRISENVKAQFVKDWALNSTSEYKQRSLDDILNPKQKSSSSRKTTKRTSSKRSGGGGGRRNASGYRKSDIPSASELFPQIGTSTAIARLMAGASKGMKNKDVSTSFKRRIAKQVSDKPQNLAKVKKA